jgi:hypothetical protein
MFPYLCLILAAATSAPAGRGASGKKPEITGDSLSTIQGPLESLSPGRNEEVALTELAPRDPEPEVPMVMPSELLSPLKAKPIAFSVRVDKEMARLSSLIENATLFEDDKLIVLRAQAAKARVSLSEIRPLLIRSGKIEGADSTENFRNAMARVEAVRRLVKQHVDMDWVLYAEDPRPECEELERCVRSLGASGLKVSRLRRFGCDVSLKELDDASAMADALLEHLGNSLRVEVTYLKLREQGVIECGL